MLWEKADRIRKPLSGREEFFSNEEQRTATSPSIRALAGLTKPARGVITTSPITILIEWITYYAIESWCKSCVESYYSHHKDCCSCNDNGLHGLAVKLSPSSPTSRKPTAIVIRNINNAATMIQRLLRRSVEVN
jgi:hypothetical protein